MKVVVIGASGRIGRKLVRKLRHKHLQVFAASPTSGVNSVTGEGLARTLAGAEVVIDVSNSPSPATALPFFAASGRNLLAAARAAGVRHHIVLSIVGLDRLLAGAYFRAKKSQEDLVKASGIPFTIVRSTQFFEFISDVVQEGDERQIRISPALVQPVAAADVAAALADALFSPAAGQTLETAGPEQFRLDAVATEIATAHEDPRQVVTDLHAGYFGAELKTRSLLPGPSARIGAYRFDDWLRDSFPPRRSYKWRADVELPSMPQPPSSSPGRR